MAANGAEYGEGSLDGSEGMDCSDDAAEGAYEVSVPPASQLPHEALQKRWSHQLRISPLCISQAAGEGEGAHPDPAASTADLQPPGAPDDGGWSPADQESGDVSASRSSPCQDDASSRSDASPEPSEVLHPHAWWSLAPLSFG